MELLEIIKNRRSVRTYSGEAVPEEHLDKIIKAGVWSASSRALCPWELIVVRDKETLNKMASCRVAGSKMLEGADCAIVVVADPDRCDVWIEDCSIVMSNMHLMAHSLGVGSCWIQGRLREAKDGRTTEAYLAELLGYPENYRLEAMLSLGMPRTDIHNDLVKEVPVEKVHRERF